MNRRPRLREMGILIGQMQPGPGNAITDVPGVQVGHTTLIRGEGSLQSGSGPVRTGVTVIIPSRKDVYRHKLPAAVHTFNGYGKAAGFEQIRELGVIETPIALTNTLNLGLVWDAVVEWTIRQHPDRPPQSLNPLVAECNDSYLNDICGRHVRLEHVLQAFEQAAGGPVPEGAVGAGTGMMCYAFKGGIGTASRLVGDYTVGVLVLSNFGTRDQLLVSAVPVGSYLRDWPESERSSDGSIVMVVATNAPLSSRQLGRLARRTGFGLARTGSTAGHSSGDFAIAFSSQDSQIETLADQNLNPFFQAVVESTEEAILNSLTAADTLHGYGDHVAYGLPLDRLVTLMHRHGYPDVHLP